MREIKFRAKSIQNFETHIEGIEIGDWVVNMGKEIICSTTNYFKNIENVTWLPLGDQLDDEIERILKEKENDKWRYSIDVSSMGYSIFAGMGHRQLGWEDHATDRNLAKIKLLKSLLEGDKK